MGRLNEKTIPISTNRDENILGDINCTAGPELRIAKQSGKYFFCIQFRFKRTVCVISSGLPCKIHNGTL